MKVSCPLEQSEWPPHIHSDEISPEVPFHFHSVKPPEVSLYGLPSSPHHQSEYNHRYTLLIQFVACGNILKEKQYPSLCSKLIFIPQTLCFLNPIHLYLDACRGSGLVHPNHKFIVCQTVIYDNNLCNIKNLSPFCNYLSMNPSIRSGMISLTEYSCRSSSANISISILSPLTARIFSVLLNIPAV